MQIKDLFSNYLRHDEVNNYLDYLAESYPDLVTVSICGQSYEKRTIKSVKISYKNVDRKDTNRTTSNRKTKHLKLVKPRRGNLIHVARKKLKKETKVDSKFDTKSIVLIDGGIHGREWMSVATAVYCIHELVENLKSNMHLLTMLEFIIVPIINVDGYEYSHTHFPLWRKTRKPLHDCFFIGTDCNRNFDYHWKKECSLRSCKNTYSGETPFSEPETKLLKTLMHSVMPNCKFYLTLHSHAKAFMYPWGYTKKPVKNWRELHKLALIGQNAIKEKTGNLYRCGSVATINRHIAAGGSPDYAYGFVKIPYTMTMELSGGSFQPPSSEIIHIVKESWIGIRAMCVYIAKL